MNKYTLEPSTPSASTIGANFTLYVGTTFSGQLVYCLFAFTCVLKPLGHSDMWFQTVFSPPANTRCFTRLSLRPTVRKTTMPDVKIVFQTHGSAKWFWPAVCVHILVVFNKQGFVICLKTVIEAWKLQCRKTYCTSVSHAPCPTKKNNKGYCLRIKW
jgi:hypothetical protein